MEKNKLSIQDEIIDNLIKKYRLGQDSRIGLVILHRVNIGDVYFASCTFAYTEKIKKKKYIIIAPENFPIQVFVRWQNSNGAGIEQVYITLEEWFYLRDYPNKNKYQGILDFFSNHYEEIFMHQSTNRKDVYENLTRPKFPLFDMERYIKDYNLIPGKTIFIIPHAIFHGTLPMYFWTMSIGLFKLLGYQVIVNANPGTKEYGDVVCCNPPLDDLVSLCDLCGYVYSIRTGLVEMLASESRAKFYIFSKLDKRSTSVLRSITLIYPHIDNSDGHIVEIPLPRNKQEFSWIKNVYETQDAMMSFMRENIYLRDKVRSFELGHDDNKVANPDFFGAHPSEVKFKRVAGWEVPAFCNIKYKLFIRDEIICYSMNVDPIREYIIHIAYKDCETKQIVGYCENYNQMNTLFTPDEDGEYSIIVHIVHPVTKHNCLFETEPISISRNLNRWLNRCKNYTKYIHALYRCKESVTIFIVSRDAHTNFQQTRELGLEAFHIHTDLKHTFRHSWLCIIDGGDLVKELTSQDKEVSADYEWDGNLASLTSVGWNVYRSDKSSVSIKINGEEVCVNSRGLNIVVWDKENKCILDSVCFDTYWRGEVSRRSSV